MKKRIIALLLIAVFCVSALTGCGKAKPTEVAVIIGENQVAREELLYYLAFYETLGNYQAAFSGQDYETFWSSKNSDGEINREVYRTVAFTELTYMVIMSEQAKKDNFSVSEEMIAEADSEAEDFFKDFTDSEKEKTGITLNGFKVALERQTLVREYEKEFVKKLAVDADAVRASLKPENFKSKKTEFIGLAKAKITETGETVNLTAPEIEEAKKTLSEALKLAKNGKSFEDIKKEAGDSITYYIGNKYLYAEQTAEEAYIKAAADLKDGEFYDGIVEGEDGLYVIKMVDTNSPDYYEKIVAEAIAAQEKNEMQKYYEVLAATYTRTIKDSIVPLEKFGSYFIVPVENATK